MNLTDSAQFFSLFSLMFSYCEYAVLLRPNIIFKKIMKILCHVYQNWENDPTRNFQAAIIYHF